MRQPIPESCKEFYPECAGSIIQNVQRMISWKCRLEHGLLALICYLHVDRLGKNGNVDGETNCPAAREGFMIGENPSAGVPEMKSSFQVPPVHLILRAYPPSPARVGLTYVPLPVRIVAVALSLGVFWGAAPWLVWVPPHYPWPVLSFCTGGWLAWRWSRRYRVRYFAGSCPRCGRELRLPRGAAINLPHSLTCFGCHFEPQLETYTEAGEERIAADEHRGIRHWMPDCTGTWSEESLWKQPYLCCSGCGARHHVTEALRTAAEAENERGRLLEQLTDEGRFLC